MTIVPNNTQDVQSLSYEDARDELIAIVAKLEAGSTTLDESLVLWERGEALAARCQELLDGARDTIERTRDKDPHDAGVVAIATQLEDSDEETDE